MARRSATKTASSSTQVEHGSARLRRVTIDHYNSLVRDPGDAEFIGDRASETGFFAIFDRLRRTERTGPDAFGPRRGPDTDKELVDRAVLGGDTDSAHLVHLAIEEYAQGFADVIAFYLAQPAWEGVERIVIGGGFPDHEFGALAVRRTERILKRRRLPVAFHVLTQDPDEGGLIGWVHAVPTPVTRQFDAFLAVDIGGTHVRCGIVEHGLRRAANGSKACVVDRMQWRHGNDKPSRDELVLRIAGMLNGLAAEARTIGLRLAPCVGIACPGRIAPDGSVPQGTQNLPDDWEPPFHLPRELEARLDPIDGEPPLVLMHNDAVIQGLGELHHMHDVSRWAVLTIGTGLGNAVYTNR